MKVFCPAFSIIMLVFLTLTVFCTAVCSQSPVDYDGFEQVIVRTRANCNKTIVMDPRSPGYNMTSQMGRYRCSTEERGFKCETTFRVQDPFSLLGFQLCADLQGVDDSFRSQCQLKVEVTSPGSDVLKGLYCTSHLNAPAYTCVTGGTLMLTFGTRPTVRVCPTILEYFFKNTFPVGSVLLRPETPVYNVYLGTCRAQNQLPDESEFIVKVHTPGFDTALIQCPRYDTSVITWMKSRMTGCLSLIYISPAYFCPMDVVLVTRRSSKELKLKVYAKLRDLPQGSQSTICKDFDYEEDGDVMLNISAHSMSACTGKLAFRVSFHQSKDVDPEDPAQINSPRVFMAVFIALIIICLVCLALTCLCCIRFRTKRLRNARRRRRHGPPTTNEGFDGPPALPYDGNISWSQSDPGMIFGLPSYEDVTGERPDGVNPASDRAHKEDLPPSYDSIFAQESSGN